MTIMSQLGGKILNNQLRTSVIKHVITMCTLLMIKQQRLPTVHDRRVRYGKTDRACRGTKAERDYKGGALISFLRRII